MKLTGVFFDHSKTRSKGVWKAIVRVGPVVRYVPIEGDISPADRPAAEKAAKSLFRKLNKSIKTGA